MSQNKSWKGTGELEGWHKKETFQGLKGIYILPIVVKVSGLCIFQCSQTATKQTSQFIILIFYAGFSHFFFIMAIFWVCSLLLCSNLLIVFINFEVTSSQMF